MTAKMRTRPDGRREREIVPGVWLVEAFGLPHHGRGWAGSLGHDPHHGGFPTLPSFTWRRCTWGRYQWESFQHGGFWWGKRPWWEEYTDTVWERPGFDYDPASPHLRVEDLGSGPDGMICGRGTTLVALVKAMIEASWNGPTVQTPRAWAYPWGVTYVGKRFVALGRSRGIVEIRTHGP